MPAATTRRVFKRVRSRLEIWGDSGDNGVRSGYRRAERLSSPASPPSPERGRPRLTPASLETIMHYGSRFDRFREFASSAQVITLGCFVVFVIVAHSALAGVLDDDGRLVRFDRDIAPILRARCLECHGPEDAKNDFRVDDVDSLMAYVSPEDLEASSLFTDYLTTDDDDMLMPPVSHQGPLSLGELALLRTWIHEGAVWPDGFELVAEAEAETPLQIVEVPQNSDGLLARVWAFQGYLHPAAVHFPIALLSIGGLFVVLSWIWPALGNQVALACLWIGSVAAIGTTLMGWSFATEQGYGAWDRIDMDTEVFWHRWSAIVVTVVAVAAALVAAIAINRNSRALNATWKGGLLITAVLVGLVGHQGGEMTYGKTFYQRAFDRLWPPIVPLAPVVQVTVEEPTVVDSVDAVFRDLLATNAAQSLPDGSTDGEADDSSNR